MGDFFAPSGMPKPLPLGEVALRSNDGEGKPGRKEPLRSDRQALCQSDTIAVSGIRRQRPSPLSLTSFASSPKGGALGMSVRLPFVQPLSLLRSTRPGCGSQHPPRSACVLLAAAPTAPPCFRHWRRSSPLPLVGEPLAKPFTLRGHAGEVIFPTSSVNLWKMHD